MYYVIIADDEKGIRGSMVRFIDKLDGFSVIGEFDNGIQVIDFLKNNRVDIVITDIKMMYATGIDIAKFIHEQKYDIKVIFISGYREFSLAQEAINYGVSGYLLKPILPKELKATLFRIAEEIKDSKVASVMSSSSHSESQSYDERVLINKAIVYIKENFSKNISIKDVAAFVYLSEDYFGKIFKSNQNMSFTEYLISIRINEAVSLLEERKYTIDEIGKRVGYKDCSYFIKIFKSVMGCTPKKYCLQSGIALKENKNED